MHTLRQAIETYLKARDLQCPSLIADAFSEQAQVRIVSSSTAISFPGEIRGQDAIVRVLVTQIAERFSSVCTSCIGAPPEDNEPFECRWLTSMTERDGGGVLVGCGRYQWQAEIGEARIASLVVTIDVMTRLAEKDHESGLAWLHGLSYPWCTTACLEKNVPAIPAIRDIARRLGLKREHAR